MTLRRAKDLVVLAADALLLVVDVVREVSREALRRVRAGRVVIRDERRDRGGTVHGR